MTAGFFLSSSSGGEPPSSRFMHDRASTPLVSSAESGGSGLLGGGGLATSSFFGGGGAATRGATKPQPAGRPTSILKPQQAAKAAETTFATPQGKSKTDSIIQQPPSPEKRRTASHDVERPTKSARVGDFAIPDAVPTDYMRRGDPALQQAHAAADVDDVDVRTDDFVSDTEFQATSPAHASTVVVSPQFGDSQPAVTSPVDSSGWDGEDDAAPDPKLVERPAHIHPMQQRKQPQQQLPPPQQQPLPPQQLLPQQPLPPQQLLPQQQQLSLPPPQQQQMEALSGEGDTVESQDDTEVQGDDAEDDTDDEEEELPAASLDQKAALAMPEVAKLHADSINKVAAGARETGQAIVGNVQDLYENIVGTLASYAADMSTKGIEIADERERQAKQQAEIDQANQQTSLMAGAMQVLGQRVRVHI
jgi:hypothetical protein